MLKKTLLLSLTATLLLATNGVNMVGTSTVSRSMGGTGVAFYSHATEAMHKNISMLGDIEKDEFQFDMTIFSAIVNSTVYDKMPLNANLAPLPNLPSYDNPITAASANMLDTNFIPSMTYATRIFDELVFGFAIIGAAGMATQYEGEYSQRQLNSSMLLMKIIPGFSYRQGNTTFGFAPVLGLGSLSLNYDDRYLDESGNSYDYGTKPQSQREGIFGTNVGGSALESAIGYTFGMDVKVTPKLRIGATYNSALKNTYKEVANFSQFGPNGMVYMADEWMRNNTGAGLTGDASTIGFQLMNSEVFAAIPDAQDIADTIQKLAGAVSITDALAATNPDHRDDLTMQQPWEIAVGFAYDITNKMVVTFDYRYIAWGTAEGYRDFGWDSQHVYAFGMQHTGKDYVLRAGYSYADSPIPNTTDEFGAVLTDVQGTLVFKQAVSMLNMVGFPAISTTHFSVGGGYAFDEDIDFDLAMMYSPTATATRSGSLNPVELGFEAVDMPYKYETTMQQLSLSFGVNYKF